LYKKISLTRGGGGWGLIRWELTTTNKLASRLTDTEDQKEVYVSEAEMGWDSKYNTNNNRNNNGTWDRQGNRKFRFHSKENSHAQHALPMAADVTTDGPGKPFRAEWRGDQ
jgi:hypothetical protein